MIRVVLSLILLFGCGQDFNSSSGDFALSADNGIDTSTAAGQRLSAAYNVIKNNCISCHSGYHNSWASYKTDAAWISKGLAVRGDTTSSQVYDRLKNVGGDMPLAAPQISDSDRQILEDWILGL